MRVLPCGDEAWDWDTPKVRGGKSLAVLGVVWAVVLMIHLVLHLPDVRLWIAFPALFVPWLLLGARTWFDP